MNVLTILRIAAIADFVGEVVLQRFYLAPFQNKPLYYFTSSKLTLRTSWC